MPADRAESPPWAAALLATDGCARVRSVRLDELLDAIAAQPLDPEHVIVTGHLAYVSTPRPYWSRLPTMHAPILTVYVYRYRRRVDTVFCTTSDWHGRYRDA